MTDEEQKLPECPVCLQHNKQEALQSQGIVLSGIEAMFNKDRVMIEALYGSFTPYDCHTAISLYAQLVDEISFMTGRDPLALLASIRADINAAQTET